MFLSQYQPTIDRGRFGFAQWLARHGPKFIQLLPHGVLVELVQLLLNQKVLLFRKGKVSVSPSLNTDPTLIMNALASASYFTGAGEPAGSPTSVSAPTTPPSTPPSQPQWPTSATSSFAHFQQQQQQQQQTQSHQHSHHQHLQQQQTASGARGYGRMTESQERFDDEHGGMESGDYVNESSVHSRHGGQRRDDVRDRMHKNRTWSHPQQFAAAFTSPQPIAPQTSSNSASGSLTPLSLFGSTSSNSPSASANSTPTITPSSSPFQHVSGRPRQGSMPPQIPRPPSTQSTVDSTSSAAQNNESSMPARVPSRTSSQGYFSFANTTSASSAQPYAAEGVSALLSPRAVERSPLVQQQSALSEYADTHVSPFTSPPSRTGTLGGRDGQLVSGGSNAGTVNTTVGTSSRKATPHTSPSVDRSGGVLLHSPVESIRVRLARLSR